MEVTGWDLWSSRRRWRAEWETQALSCYIHDPVFCSLKQQYGNANTPDPQPRLKVARKHSAPCPGSTNNARSPGADHRRSKRGSHNDVIHCRHGYGWGGCNKVSGSTARVGCGGCSGLTAARWGTQPPPRFLWL